VSPFFLDESENKSILDFATKNEAHSGNEKRVESHLKKDGGSALFSRRKTESTFGFIRHNGKGMLYFNRFNP
jgi:hypothetical protein